MSKNKEAFESPVKQVQNNETASCIVYETASKKTYRQPVEPSFKTHVMNYEQEGIDDKLEYSY